MWKCKGSKTWALLHCIFLFLSPFATLGIQLNDQRRPVGGEFNEEESDENEKSFSDRYEFSKVFLTSGLVQQKFYYLNYFSTVKTKKNLVTFELFDIYL